MTVHSARWQSITGDCATIAGIHLGWALPRSSRAKTLCGFSPLTSTSRTVYLLARSDTCCYSLRRSVLSSWKSAVTRQPSLPDSPDASFATRPAEPGQALRASGPLCVPETSARVQPAFSTTAEQVAATAHLASSPAFPISKDRRCIHLSYSALPVGPFATVLSVGPSCRRAQSSAQAATSCPSQQSKQGQLLTDWIIYTHLFYDAHSWTHSF